MKVKQSIGIVFDIQRYSIHDGPGIRTLVFMKGCPLRCLWCANPEGQRFEPTLLFVERQCVGCQNCVENCPVGAISEDTKRILWTRELCVECFECLNGCHSQARQVCGKSFTVEQLLDEVEKDRAFFRRSHGGVTIGGGDPLAQSEFCREFLKEAKKSNLRTAIETSGYGQWKHLKDLMEYTDILFIDIKHMNSVQHKKLTGKANELILKNIEKASEVNLNEETEIVIRIPVIPTLNDSEENIRATAEFARSLKSIKKIELLPYHNMGQAKYKRTKWTEPYSLHELKPVAAESLLALKEIVEACGLVGEIAI